MSEASEETTSETTETTETQATQTWQDSFSADMRSNPSFSKFAEKAKDANEFGANTFRGYIELQKALGGDRIALPGDDATDEEWGAFYAKTGRPEKPDGYGLGEWKPPDGVPWDDTTTAHMIERFHAHGLSTKQAQGVLNDYAEMAREYWDGFQDSADKETEEGLGELRKSWGAAYDGKMAAAKRASVAIAGVPGEDGNLFDQIILQDGRCLGDDKRIIERLAWMGEQFFTEDGGMGIPVSRSTKTPEEAKQELADLIGSPENMKILTDISHPQHKFLTEKRIALESQIHNV